MVLTIMEAKGKDAWGLLLVLLLGQLVAFSMAVSSFTSSLIATLGVDAPLTQSFFAYLLLTLVYVPILLKRRQKLQIPWYWYLALAFIDVQGNYLVVKAYQYSYITSVTLLDCWTVVWVVILTWYALGTRYSFWQFVGAGTCVAGLALVLLSDSKSADAQDPSKIPLLGDALVIAGTIFFAFSNVGEEYCVKKKDRVEFVAMFALFGLLLCLFAGFAVALFMFYSITPFVLKMSGSTLFNLSLLTSDMWAVAIRVLFYHQQINWLYYIAFAVVAIGLIIYSLNDHSSDSGTRTTASTEAAAQYQQLPGEDNSTGIGSNDSQERKQEEETTTPWHLEKLGFSPSIVERFLWPLLAGIFFDPALDTLSRLALRDNELPRPASAPSPDSVRLNSCTAAIGQSSVPLDTGDAKPHPAPQRLGKGIINNMFLDTSVAPSSVAAGKVLVSFSLVGSFAGRSDADLAGEVVSELGGWFGAREVASWTHLTTYCIGFARPDQMPPTGRDPRVRRRTVRVRRPLRAEKIRRSRKAIIPEGVLHHFLPPLKARERCSSKKNGQRLMKNKSAPWSMMFLVFLGQLVSFSMAMPWYWYLALAFIDVQGNCLAIKAYHYSYITSVNLLNCWTITWVMILTRFALGTRYSLWQFVGAGTCMTGLALVLLSDSNYSDVQDESKRPLLGDALIIVATFCFAFSNVGEEYCVKNKDRIEFVAMLGIFGMLIGLFIGFAVASLVFSSIAPFVLKVNWLYYLAFAVVAIGLIIYSINESSDDETAASTMETETQYDYEQLLCE
uniref:Uncharacterized protein n=1 Tax=Oryza nivara TaxID=4536 RepID=A0A0E0HF82_ORYNI